MNRTDLFHHQNAVVFAETRTLEQLMKEVGESRTLPVEGTNLSSVFGQTVLGTLGLTEEQLDWTIVLKTFPPAELAIAEESDNPLDYLKTQLQFRMQREQTTSRQLWSGIVKAQVELPTLKESKAAIRIARLEKHAAEIPQVFITHCRTLQRSLSSIHTSQKTVIGQLLDFPHSIGKDLSPNSLEGLFFNLTLDPDVEPATTRTFVQLVAAVSDQVFNDAEINEIHTALVSGSLSLKEKFPSKFGFSVTSKTAMQLLQSSLHPELFSSMLFGDLTSDAMALKYFFGLLSPAESLLFPQALYYRLTESATSQLIATLPELLIQPMLSQLCNGLCSLLYCLSLVIIYFVKFARPMNEHAFNAALLTISQHYLTLTRVSELVGVQSTHLFRDYLTVLVDLIPNFMSQPQTQLDGVLRLDPAPHGHYSTVHETLWAYSYPSKPWMPTTYRSFSAHSPVAFDLVKADRIMNMLEHADSRLLWRWCGLSQPNDVLAFEENAMQSVLFKALCEQSVMYPEKLISRKLMASLLFQASQNFPRFYTASSHRHFIDTVIKEELPVEEPVDDTSGWDSLDLDIP
jgi:hypothetical protein